MRYLVDFKGWTRLNEEACQLGSIPAGVEEIRINGKLGKQDCSDWKWKSAENEYLLVGYLVNSGNGEPGVVCTLPYFEPMGANTVGNNLNEWDDLGLFKEIGTVMGYVSNEGVLNKKVERQISKTGTGKVWEWRVTGDESSLINLLASLSKIEWPWTPAG